jgi:hypothetical protein
MPLIRTRVLTRVLLPALTFLLAVMTIPAVAQTPPAIAPQPPAATVNDTLFMEVWQRVAKQYESELGRATTPEARTEVYRRMLRQFVADPAFVAIRESPGYRDGVRQMIRELPDSATAQSTNAPITNPASNALIERSGASQLIALAADVRQLFASDESAISLNLNAIALFGGGKKKQGSAQAFYSHNEQWRRLTGTVTFGAKVPERAITGFSGLPSADDLFDAISWDTKVRLIGDRDPLASRWYPLLLGQVTQELNLLVRILGLPVDPADIGPLRTAANDVFGASFDAAKERIASSLQLSIKGSGVHLTNATGKNHYSIAAMLDKGFNLVDVTANLSYNVADLPPPGATDPFSSKDVQLSAGLTTSLLKDRIVSGRSAELSGSFQARVFVDDGAVPIDRKNTFAANATLVIPFQLKGKIPVSLSWTNDPNSLKKETFVTGQIGISYDLGAIKDALK